MEAEQQQQPDGEEAATRAGYESAFAAVKDKPCRVAEMVVLGLARTKLSVVQRELQRVRGATTLEEIKDALLEAYVELVGLNVFEVVDLVLDEGGEGDACDVIAQFQEKNIMHLATGIYGQGQEGSVEGALKLCNPLGYAEQITLRAECGSQSPAGLNSTTYALALTKPRPFGLGVVADARLHQLFHNCTRWSSYTELLRGGALTLSSENGTQALSYELAWRRLTDPTCSASPAVQQHQLGDKMLSALKYVRRHSTFDDPIFPTAGWMVHAESQIAGLGLDAHLLRFIKQRVAAKVALAVSDETTLTLSAEAGVLLPWGARAWSSRTSISDRFFLGGIGAGGALRGFTQKGVGPTDARRKAEARERDALGGDVFCSVLAALNFQLPHEGLRATGCHGQLFVNGGTIAALSGTGRGLQQCVHELVTSFRWSVGVGLVLPTQIGRLELNLCRVLASQENDRAKVGVQFGFAA